MLRTHNCNELGTDHIGQSVVLTGWLANVRDHGGVLFVDLRDHYGVTQIVFSDAILADMLVHLAQGRRVLGSDHDTARIAVDTVA